MTSPVDPARRFYDALGRRDVAGGQDLPEEEARQQHQRRPGRHLNIRSDGKQCAVKAFIFERNGEPTDVLGIRDLPDPLPGPGEVLVRIRLSPIHPAYLHVLRGRFGRQPTPPTSPGFERRFLRRQGCVQHRY
jgi:hypothetical protein